MKKLFTVFVLCCISSVTYSQSIVLVSSNIDFLRSEKHLRFDFTYDDMLVGKMTESEYVDKKVGEYNAKEVGKGDLWRKAWVEDRETRFKPKFLELFTKYMEENGTPLTIGDANYVVNVNTCFTEPGFNVGVVRRNASVDLVCKIINKSTGAQEALINIRDASANNFWGVDFETGYRLQESYAKAGRELAKFMIKRAKLIK